MSTVGFCLLSQVLRGVLLHHCYRFFFLSVCLFCRSLTSNLPNVNLPNVNLQIPKVPNLPVPVAGLSVNLPQMPSFSTPSWMAAIYDSECVLRFVWLVFLEQGCLGMKMSFKTTLTC